MARMSNKELIIQFVYGSLNKTYKNYSDNLFAFIINDNRKYLKNYNAIICKKEGNTFYINKKYLHFSKTTQKNINMLERVIVENDYKFDYKEF